MKLKENPDLQSSISTKLASLEDCLNNNDL